MDILIINSLIILNSLNSVMINYELFRRNVDSERLSYTITELLLLRQLLLRRVIYGLWILSRSQLPRRRRGCCVIAIIWSLPDSTFELISPNKYYNLNHRGTGQHQITSFESVGAG